MTISDDERQYQAAMKQADDLESSRKIRPDYHWIKIDETRHWTKEFLRKIGADARILVTYVFDHNTAVHCCEITPSYELHRAGTEFITSRDLSLEEAEEIDEGIRVADLEDDHDVVYFHCNDIDLSENVSAPIRQFVDCDEETTIDDVVEYYQGNPW